MKYLNADKTSGVPPWGDVVRWFLSRRSHGSSPCPTPPRHMPAQEAPADGFRVIYIGHSTLLVEIGGVVLLTDPVYSRTCGAVPGIGARRFHPPGIPFEELPPVSTVLVTHNHYDHLDRATIRRLEGAPLVIVPAGLARWFRAIGRTNVVELDWWGRVDVDGVRVTSVPARHWSRRTPWDTNRSHWCSYVIEHGPTTLFFCGDTGYCSCFCEVSSRFPAIQLAALPIGAYAPRWFMAPRHMAPFEAVRAFCDLRAGVFMAIHHSTFRLSDEPPDEPARMLRDAWTLEGLAPDRLWVPEPGEWRCSASALSH